MCACALMGIGLVFVYSASFIFAYENYGDGLYFFKRQIIFVVLALASLGLASQVPYIFLKKYFWFFWTILVLGLCSLFVPGLGHRVGGALRWINLPLGLHAEPGEVAKLMSPVIFSYLLTRDNKSRPWLQFWFIASAVILIPVFLLMKQPDFGSSVIFFLVGLTLLFSFGFPWKYLVSAAIVSIPLFYVLVMRVAYRRARVLAFINPWADPSNSGFQVIQSMLSIHSGGLFGAGIGKGQSKLFFLPEAHTDFILAVLGEELGFVGLLCVLALVAWLVLRGFQIAMRCDEPFGRRLAIGMSCLIAYGAIINTGVVTGLLPTKGLTMPFLSYGGSSLIAVGLACGVLINIYKSTFKENSVNSASKKRGRS
jgi:cell division protein FtsW